MIYLASPYTHRDPLVMDYRHEAALMFTLEQLQRGHTVFSPIVYGRQFESTVGHTFEDWKTFNDVMLGRSTQVWVLKLDEWEMSRGVRYEIAEAQRLGIDISFKEYVHGGWNAGR